MWGVLSLVSVLVPRGNAGPDPALVRAETPPEQHSDPPGALPGAPRALLSPWATQDGRSRSRGGPGAQGPPAAARGRQRPALQG